MKSLLIELQDKRLKHRFPVEFTKFLKTEVNKQMLLKPLLSPEVSTLISYTCGSNRYFGFVSEFTVLLANSPFITNTIDTAIIRSSRLVVLCEKGVLINFAKFTRKHLR